MNSKGTYDGAVQSYIVSGLVDDIASDLHLLRTPYFLGLKLGHSRANADDHLASPRLFAEN